MANRKSPSVKVKTTSPVQPVPVTRPWDLVFSGNIQAWKAGAAVKFGMEGDMYSDCYLDSESEVADGRFLSESHYKVKEFLGVERSGGQVTSLMVERRSPFAMVVQEDYPRRPAAQACSRDIAVLHFVDLQKMVSDPDFPLLPLSSPHITMIYQFPQPRMSVISCTLTPDLSMTAVLFRMTEYAQSLNYSLHLFSNNSGELVKSVPLSRGVRPYFSFDPCYSWSRLAVVNYENREDNVRHDLVVLSLDSEKILQQSVCSLLATNNRKFCMQHSKDGALLILQKLTDDFTEGSTCSDIFIFQSSHLQLIKHISITVPDPAIGSFEAMLSKCGRYMRVPVPHSMVEDLYGEVNVYQLPPQLNLMSQCRNVILQHLPHSSLVDSLPLPSALKDYLLQALVLTSPQSSCD